MDEPIHEIIRRHCRPLRPLPTGVEPRLKRLPGIKAVLFDLYGTLFVSGAKSHDGGTLEPSGDAMAEGLQAVGVAFRASKEQLASTFAETLQRQRGELLQQGNEQPEVVITEVWRETLHSLMAGGWVHREQLTEARLRQIAAEYECRTNPVWPMPQIEPCLGGLRSVGILLGIVSNAQFLTRAIFPALMGASTEELGFDPQLQFFSYEYGSAKPGLALHRAARTALAELGVQPEQVLSVGNDFRSDVETAARAGFRSALFAGDQRSLRPGDGAATDAPDLVVTELMQLLPCVAVL
ncbi:MAG: HAD family hydrolase [Planctomycetota bacterium]